LNRKIKSVARAMALLAVLVAASSCRTVQPLPPADLSSPGWHVLQGQAVWKPSRYQDEMTGDLLLATNASGDYYVQLTKDPFQVVNAEVLNGEWQIQFEGGKYDWRGRGAPPPRFLWFQLPRAILGDRPAGDWRFENVSSNDWRLYNSWNGESLEGGFFP
jgi:hypothetical protein